MSSDPFGRSDRTVIRPNPGGRRPAPQQPMAPMPASPAPPSAAPAPVPMNMGPAPAYVPRPSDQPAGAPPPAASDDWIVTQGQAAPVPTDVTSRVPVIARHEVVTTPNENPFMRAAGPLLLLLGRLRVALFRASPAALMEQVAEAIQNFEKDVRQAGASPEQTRTAKYLVAATADDIVQNIPVDDRHVWTQYSMLARFFGERVGGVRFFEELDRAKMDPLGNYAVLELQHACLALGFQGVYRTQNGGAARLQQIQRELYEILRRVRAKVTDELSPHWRGQNFAVLLARYQVPIWAIAALVAALLFALFLTLRMLLGNAAEATAEQIASVHPTDPLGIQRRVFAPPPPPPPPPDQLKRVRAALQDPAITVTSTPNQIVIRIANLALFDPGSATLKEQFKPLAAKIAAVLEKEPGPVKVIGHTDAQPISNVRFPNNFVLSVERAKAVAGALKPQVSKQDRFEIEGKGPDVPVAPNTTAEGRAQNRRVELLVQRSEK